VFCRLPLGTFALGTLIKLTTVFVMQRWQQKSSSIVISLCFSRWFLFGHKKDRPAKPALGSVTAF